MSRQINQPINQVKLTNVAIVRCNKEGKRFEIACYRNKVMDYRNGLETDLSEVLQTDRIFTNVTKGQFAKAADLQKAFKTRDQEEIAKRIIDQSPDFQVSDLERAQVIKDTLSQIATWISQNCVYADGSDRPFPTTQIKEALGKNYTVHPHKPIKKQCLDAVKFLKDKSVLPIERAKMELQLQYPADQKQTVQSALDRHSYRLVRSENETSPCTTVIQADPSLYRELTELMTSVEGILEILEQVVMAQQGDIELEQQLEMNNNRNQATDKPTGEGNQGAGDPDSDVEDIVEKLQTIRHVAVPDEETDEGTAVALLGGNEHDDILAGSSATSRKQQKNNRKKSKKQKRREQEEKEERRQMAENERRRQEQLEVKRNAQGNNEAQDLAPQQQTSTGEGAKSCNTCGGSFANAAEYRAHFRSDWHRFNQKLKLKGVAPVSQEEFLLCDADTFFGGS